MAPWQKSAGGNASGVEAPGVEPSHDNSPGADLPAILGASTRSYRLLLACLGSRSPVSGNSRATGRRKFGWYDATRMSVSHDTSEDAARVQLEVYRRMAPSQRLNVGLELTRMSRDLLAQGIRARHPEYSDDEVKWAVIRVWIGRDMFRRAYPHGPQLDP